MRAGQAVNGEFPLTPCTSGPSAPQAGLPVMRTPARASWWRFRDGDRRAAVSHGVRTGPLHARGVDPVSGRLSGPGGGCIDHQPGRGKTPPPNRATRRCRWSRQSRRSPPWPPSGSVEGVAKVGRRTVRRMAPPPVEEAEPFISVQRGLRMGRQLCCPGSGQGPDIVATRLAACVLADSSAASNTSLLELRWRTSHMTMGTGEDRFRADRICSGVKWRCP